MVNYGVYAGREKLVRSSRQFNIIDAHTVGSPVRVVVGGVGPVPGGSIAEKRDWLRENRDDVRTLLMYEPRGHAGMSGSIVLDPCDSRADVGVVFMEVSGWLPMCGHGTIGTVTALVESGSVPMAEPMTEVVLEVPAGLVRAQAEVTQGAVKSVTVENVPSFLEVADFEVQVPRWGRLMLDVAYGGNYYAIVRAADLGIELVPSSAEQILSAARAIRSALEDVLDPVHPETPWVRGISHVMLTEPVSGDTKVARNTVFYGESGIARDPCGTGTSARMAQLFARGELAIGEMFVHEGLIGTTYHGWVNVVARVGDREALRTSIRGSAYVTATTDFLLDPSDPFPRGFGIGYGSDVPILGSE